MRVTCAVHYIRHKAPQRPWVIVGKGPSLDDGLSASAVPSLLAQSNVLTLNHACTVVRPTIAHFVDWEAYADCMIDLAKEAHRSNSPPLCVCLPWHPHVRFKAGRMTLDEHVDDNGIAYYDFAQHGRLLSYNSSTAGSLPSHPDLYLVTVRHFGSVAAFNLLATAGVRTVYTLGVDGGTGYARPFDQKDRLANGRNSFDAQFPEIERTVAAHGIQWEKL